MAGDWLKVEKDTPDKPEVLAIAERLSITPEEAFGRCFKVWRWADSQTTDGNARSVTEITLDRVAGLSGFAGALRQVGWLVVREGSLLIPNFDRHMGQSAKARALTAIRVSQSRKRKCNAETVTPSSLLSSSLEGLGVQGEGKPRSNLLCDNPELIDQAKKIAKHYQQTAEIPHGRGSKGLEAIIGCLNAGHSAEALCNAASGYAAHCRNAGIDQQHRFGLATFYAASGDFEEYLNWTGKTERKPYRPG